MGLKVCFRADASLQIGTGHVMRCLTLADALRELGAECRFICREHPGNLIELIRSKGYVVHDLPCLATRDVGASSPAHAAWLGSSQLDDAAASVACLAEWSVDWLIVDHYALDAHWESFLLPFCRKLMVIDDLADRPHVCDLLLDQTFGRDPSDYCAWVPKRCQLLCGSQYALLRPEFAALRSYSLQRRVEPQLQQLLITMGGVDKDNATGQVLEVLRTCSLPIDTTITVVMGATAPWLSDVKRLSQEMPWRTQILVGVSEMARLMADSDLAIGAAGATSWERCCLGLPTLMLVLAENQYLIAQTLSNAGAARMVEVQMLSREPLFSSASLASDTLAAMSAVAASLVDGDGRMRVVNFLAQEG